MRKEFTIYDTDAEYNYEDARREYAELRGISPDGVSDEEVNEFIYDESGMDFECEQDNLNRVLEGKILAIADLGLWSGRVSGYKLLGTQLAEILTFANEDSFKLYSDGKDIRKIANHHDGTNRILFREVRNGVNIENLTGRIYHNETINRKTLDYYTKSLLPVVAEIYGI